MSLLKKLIIAVVDAAYDNIHPKADVRTDIKTQDDGFIQVSEKASEGALPFDVALGVSIGSDGKHMNISLNKFVMMGGSEASKNFINMSSPTDLRTMAIALCTAAGKCITEMYDENFFDKMMSIDAIDPNIDRSKLN